MGPSILVIDDSDITLDWCANTLPGMGFPNVATVQNPADALERVLSGVLRPDVVLIGAALPQIGGVEVCARIRINPATAEVPILMLVHEADTNVMQMALMAGANDYLPLPIRPMELEARINNCLRLKSEVARRKESEARLAATSLAGQFMSPQGGSDASFLTNAVIFDAALNALPEAQLADLGLIAMGIQRDPRSQLRGPLHVPPSLGARLATVDMPGNAILAPYADGLFLFAALGVSEQGLSTLAHRFAFYTDRDDPARSPLVMVTKITRPSSASGLAVSVGDAIREVHVPAKAA